MSIFPNRRIFAIPAAVALMALAAPVALVQAQEDSWVSNMETSAIVALTGGDYAWWADLSQPAPALLADYGTYFDQADGLEKDVPQSWYDAARAVTVTFYWGDGTSSTFRSNEQSDVGSFFCDTWYYFDEVSQVTMPGEDYGYRCRIEAGHTYTTYTPQGVKTITIMAAQEGNGGSPVAYTYEQLVVSLSTSGSIRAKGTLLGRDGGMYDQEFATTDGNKTVSFDITAKRRSATTATQASVLVTAPGMLPDYTQGADVSGMTFKGSAAWHPLFVMKTSSGTEVILDRVEGRVTNTLNGIPGHDAGGAWATIHVYLQKGHPTLMRVSIGNTSAGYTYLDTGYQPTSFYQLSPLDLLLSGSVKVG